MSVWLACIVIGIITVAYSVAQCPNHPSASRSRFETAANLGVLLLLLGVVMISWRFVTVMALLPK